MPYIPRQLLGQGPVDNSEPSYRMSMLPFGTYADPNGGGEHLGFAMPGMIQEPINALMRLGQNTRFDDGRLGIPNPQNLDNQHDTATLIESLFGGNAMRGAGPAEAASLAPMAEWPAKAAIRVNGKIYDGVTHADALNKAYARYGDQRVDTWLDHPGAEIDAFLTNTGRFVRNDEASALAGFRGSRSDGRIDSGDLSAFVGPDAPEALAILREEFPLDFGGNATRGAGAGERAVLSMDDASRFRRAAEQGFDTSKTWYHGTDHDFDAFDYSKLGQGGGREPVNPISPHGAFFTDDPEYAAMYGKNVKPVYLKGNYPEIYDPIANRPEAYENLDIRSDMIGALKRGGLDGVTLTGPGTYPERIAFDPANIRSVNAAFDPANVGKNGLLLSDTGQPSLFGAAVAGAEGNTPLRGYRGAASANNLIHGDQVWGSSRPDVASSYAHAPDYDTTRTPVVAPMDFHFQNPMEVDAGGNLWHSLPKSLAPEATTDPFRFPDRFRPDLLTTDDLADLARSKGHDGLVVRNVMDSLFANNAMPMSQPAGVSDVYAALKRGTVKSPLTGETLFSGHPSMGAAAVADPYQDQQPQPSRNPLLDMPPAIVQEQPGLSGLQTFASGGNVADTSGLSGLRSLPDYGFGPMTPTTIAGYPNSFISSREPDPTWGDQALEIAEAPAKGLVGQFNTATDQIANAASNPTIPNITGAGFNTAMLFGRPAAAGVALATGIGALGAKQFLPGLFGFGSDASAGAADATMPGLTPAQMDQYTKNQRIIRRIGDKDNPRVMQALQENQTLQGISADYVRTQNQADLRARNAASDAAAQKTLNDETLRKQVEEQKQQEYSGAVSRAESARDAELGRIKRFSTWDSPWKSLYENIGGEAAAPFSTGLAEGALARMALGPASSIPGKIVKDWVIPLATGALSGYAVSNVPDAYNYQANDPDNPYKAAADVYARELPPGHPRKQEAYDYAKTLPDTNPIRDAALEDYYGHMGERALIGGTEGFAGAKFGNLAASALGRFGSGIRDSMFGTGPSTATRIEPTLPLLSAVSREIPEDVAALRAGTREAVDRSSGAAGPASGPDPLPRLDASDIAPVSPAPARKPRGARRSKSAGSKEPSVPEAILPASPSASPASPVTQEAAADELKQFFGLRLAPTPRGKAAGGAVHGTGYANGGDVNEGPELDAMIARDAIGQPDADLGKFALSFTPVPMAVDGYNDVRGAFSGNTTDWGRAGLGAAELGAAATLPFAQKFLGPILGLAKKFESGGAVDGPGESGRAVAGPLHAASGGRTDVLPIDVAAGSYVVPADIISALGEGNTNAGTRVIEHMFPTQAPSLHYASGGKVPIIAAGGEHVLTPEQVAAVGGGDLNHGHSILDAWVTNTRNDTINTLKALPGPQK